MSLSELQERRWVADRLIGVIADVIASEMARLRVGSPPISFGTLDPGSTIGADPATGANPLGADSLEVLNLAMAVSRMFHVHETDLDDAFLFRRSLQDWAELVCLSRRHADTEITFATSGSTGEAKTSVHRMADLDREIAHLSELFGDRRRIVAAQPRHHIYGFLFTVLLPAALDRPFLDRRDALPSALLAKAAPGDLVVGHPTLLDLATRVPVRVAEDVTVVTSTAPCPRPVWDRLREAGVQRVVEIYGSTETGGIGQRDDPDHPFTLFPYWRRDADGSSADALRATGDGRSIALGDAVDWTGDRQFLVRGRRDAAVQVGGVNVFPGRVAQVLLSHPEIADAAVRRMGADEGDRLKAFIVAEPGSSLSAEALTEWLNDRLSSAETPRAFTFGPELPRTQAGKPSDWPIG